MANTLRLSLVALMIFMFQGAIASDGHGGAVKTMATILSHLNHHPSGAEKEQLQMIVHDSHASAASHTLAQAMINLNHKVEGADKTKLQEVAHDSHATEDERTLANILLHLNHKPSSGDKEKLSHMH